MSRVTVEDRFPNLVRALSAIESDRRLEDETSQVIMEEWVRPAGRIVLNELKRQAPSGERWTEDDFEVGGQTISHGRPSERLFGTTLADAWNEPAEWAELGEGGFDISSEAPHMRLVLEGSSGAFVTPKRGKLLAWNRQFNNFGRPGETQTQIAASLGARPANLFHERAADIARSDLVELMGDAIPRFRSVIARWLHYEIV